MASKNEPKQFLFADILVRADHFLIARQVYEEVITNHSHEQGGTITDRLGRVGRWNRISSQPRL